jgi:hypothetical protein
MANSKKKYDVISPDGFSISFSDTYGSIKKAKEAFENWKKRFEAQGYYSSNGGRIPLDELEEHCAIVEI